MISGQYAIKCDYTKSSSPEMTIDRKKCIRDVCDEFFKDHPEPMLIRSIYDIADEEMHNSSQERLTDKKFQEKIILVEHDLKAIDTLFNELSDAKDNFLETCIVWMVQRFHYMELLSVLRRSQNSGTNFWYHLHYWTHQNFNKNYLYGSVIIALLAWLFSSATQLLNANYVLCLFLVVFFCYRSSDIELIENFAEFKSAKELMCLERKNLKILKTWIEKSEQLGQLLKDTVNFSVLAKLCICWRKYLRNLQNPEYDSWWSGMLLHAVKEVYSVASIQERYTSTFTPLIATYLLGKILLCDKNRELLLLSTKTRHVRVSVLRGQMEVIHEDIHIHTDFVKAIEQLEKEQMLMQILFRLIGSGRISDEEESIVY